MIRDAITVKYQESLRDPLRRSRYKLSVHKAGEAYLVWIKVPSEKYSIDYDVVFRLTFDTGVRAIMSAQIQLYCNSPGWFMPVGYVAARNGLLISGWEHALGHAATDPPTSINPSLDYGYDKTTFRAILFMTGVGGLVTINDLEAASRLRKPAPNPRDPKLSAQAKLHEYQRAKAKADAVARTVRIAERKTREEEAKKARASAKAASNSAKAAKTAAAAKAARQAANAGRRKSRTAK